MARRGFTIVELLAVMMIMGLMGTIAVGGYRAMQRGMEERGVMQNVNAMIRAAYQRAQIDRQPTVVFMWNETVRGRTEDENELVVGHAVAVRRHGRLSNVKNGNLLVDEFADLNLGYPTAEDGDDGAAADKAQSYIYPMDNLNDLTSQSSLKRSLVRSKVYPAEESLVFLSGEIATTASGGGETSSSESANTVPAWAFYVEDAGGVTWKPGMAYGFEFIHLTLPDGYLFGSDYSSSIDSPIRSGGTLVFKPGVNSGRGSNTDGVVGRSTVTIYSLRPDGSMLKKHEVGTSDNPEG